MRICVKEEGTPFLLAPQWLVITRFAVWATISGQLHGSGEFNCHEGRQSHMLHVPFPGEGRWHSFTFPGAGVVQAGTQNEIESGGQP